MSKTLFHTSQPSNKNQFSIKKKSSWEFSEPKNRAAIDSRFQKDNLAGIQIKKLGRKKQLENIFIDL